MNKIKTNLLFTVIVIILFSKAVLAKEMGINFYVDVTVANTVQQQNDFRGDLIVWVSEMEDFYNDSGIDLQPIIVGIEFDDFSQGEIDLVTLKNSIATKQEKFSDIFSRADELGADYSIVVLHTLVNAYNQNICGSASGVGSTISKISSLELSYAVMADSWSCQASTLAHELGHIQGLVHGDYVDVLAGDHVAGRLSDQAKGWGEGNQNGMLEANEFGTMMVGNYQAIIEGNRRLVPVFSNIKVGNYLCGYDLSCGDAVNGDAASVINDHIDHYTSHAERDIHTIHFQDAELSNCISSAYPIVVGDRYNDVDQIVNIECTNMNINNIEGIEEITGLAINEFVNIDLSGNNIEDISPLQGLHTSAVIDLSNNDAIGCDQLDQLALTHDNLIRSDICL